MYVCMYVCMYGFYFLINYTGAYKVITNYKKNERIQSNKQLIEMIQMQ